MKLSITEEARKYLGNLGIPIIIKLNKVQQVCG
jgi:hypothetical protein